MNKQIIKYLYYFFNCLVVFFLILIVIQGGQLVFLLKDRAGQKDDLLVKKSQQELTLDFILSRIQPAKDLVSLAAVGDIMLSRVVGQKMQANGYDYPLAKMINIIKDADLTFGNLETAVFPGRAIETGEMMFRADPEVLTSLVQAGFDVVSLANNHTPNFGPAGLKKTFHYLQNSGLEYVGAGENFNEAHQPVIKEINHLKIAFLAYNDSDVVPDSYEAGNNWAGTAIMDVDQLKKDLQKVHDQVDLVIVSVHSGIEYAPKPNARQVAFAHAAIDHGADLVIGHHPHVVQEMEKYQGKYIFYSLGNFIFDQMWSEETREGLVLKLLLTKDGVEDFILQPVVIDDYAQPRPASAAESEKILSRLNFNLETRKVLIYQEGGYKIEQRRGVFTDELNKDKNEDEDLIVYHDQDSERVYVLKNKDIIWSSDPAWRVKKIAIGDVNFDGMKDLVMIVWKKGNYGREKPFWVKKNDLSISNHLFVFSLKNNELKPLWQSSAIKQPNLDLLIDDLNSDGKDELIVLENEKENKNHENEDEDEDRQAEYVAVWQWDDWGFKNIWRSEKGEYQHLGLVLGQVVVE